MTDKFILMNLDDERSKKIAHVLSNKTAKKIIDLLGDINEASEKDIADKLKSPINTIEYSLKKLLDVGLVEKTKNFFWSKKGKKIPMYKLAKKHIVISPKKMKPSITSLKTIIPVIVAIVVIALLINILNPSNVDIDIDDIDQSTVKTFNSKAELEEFLEENQANKEFYSGFGTTRDFAMAESSVASVAGADSSIKAADSYTDDFSETNIQVEGVDEPDIVKNDGKYIYYVINNQVIIIDAYPSENMKILSKINVTESYVSNIFINKDKLIVFSNEYKSGDKTLVLIYDVIDKKNPELEKQISVDGYYNNARMINNYVYLITNQFINSPSPVLPAVEVDGVSREVAVKSIRYFPYPDTSYTFTNILALNVFDEEYEIETFLTGASHTVYVSQDNIYLTYTKRISSNIYLEDLINEVIKPLLPSSEQKKIEDIMESDKTINEKYFEVNTIVEYYSLNLKGKEKANFDQALLEDVEEFMIELQKKTEMTIIHKINIDKDIIEYITNGEVPGRILNQFSMDQYNGNFRIATTTGDSWWGSREESLNHLYVLDSDLEIIGKVEDLAKGERIYSTRFLGEKAYMVTFRQVDPLYVIDLSNPNEPEVLGYLKVTGYSSYLHPYDEDHIIGIGMEATEEGRVEGVKIALFDVSDVKNPKEKARYEVEGEWSNSNALYDHKAFLFNKDKELLVLPMSYTEEWTSQQGERKYEHWQGAFVFNINENQIILREKIDHKENSDVEGYYYGPYAVQRSLYMDDTLYTVSRSLIKANDLGNLKEINKLKLPNEEYYPYPMIEDEVRVF